MVEPFFGGFVDTGASVGAWSRHLLPHVPIVVPFVGSLPGCETFVSRAHELKIQFSTVPIPNGPIVPCLGHFGPPIVPDATFGFCTIAPIRALV